MKTTDVSSYDDEELLRGQTLADCLKTRTLTIEEKIDVILQVCEGLSVASGAGVCHRDVKPGNLFLKADGAVKILDFGIARLASSSMTASGYIVGTPDYMSPEQARGGAIDERSDIFSVGAVLYPAFGAPQAIRRARPTGRSAQSGVGGSSSDQSGGGAARTLANRFQGACKSTAFAIKSSRNSRASSLSGVISPKVETRVLATDAAQGIDSLGSLAAGNAQDAAEALGIRSASDVDEWVSHIAAGYPELLREGTDALRFNPWHRQDVNEIFARINNITSTWVPRVEMLRAAAGDVETATNHLNTGNGRGALAHLEAVQRQVPSAGIQPLLDRARQLLAEQQARDDRVTSLLGEARDAGADRRYDAAVTLVREALGLDAENSEARELLSQVERHAKAAVAEKARQCERSLERARRALQLEQFEEAERQLQIARESGAVHPNISVVGAALAEARSARDKANAVIQEIATELAGARGEFQEGLRTNALARLEALATRHPSSTAAQAELVRLRAEDERLSALERAVRPDQLAADAADALTKNDDVTAARLAKEALARVPVHELALRTAAVAKARRREREERAERQERSKRSVENAQTLLARGRLNRAIKEARHASELDPSGRIAPAVIAEALRRQAEAAAAELKEKEQAQRAAEVRKLLTAANKALRSQDFVTARRLASKGLHSIPKAPRQKR